MQLVEDFHLQSAQRLSPGAEFILNMSLQFLFAVAILVNELPVVFRLAQLLLCAFHVFNHLAKALSVFSDQSHNFLFLTHIATLMLAKKSAVRTNPYLASRQANQLFNCFVLLAEPNGFFHLLFLLFENFSFCFSKAVMKI